MIPEIETYEDLFKKVLFDFNRYKTNLNHPYDLMNCLLGLNALPEWLVSDPNANAQLQLMGKQKNEVMKDNVKVPFDLSQIGMSIDHQLKFIRLYCNHSKHNTKNNLIPTIKVTQGSFPYTLPIKFFNFISIGNNNYDVEYLLNDVIDFWQKAFSVTN